MATRQQNETQGVTPFPVENYRTFPWPAISLPSRLRAAGQSPGLPLGLLLLALSAMFLFGNDRGAFYRPGHHNFLSAQSMTLAANLSPEHNFLMHFREIPDADGNVAYDPYNRFPLGTYALIKLAILPFDSDLSAQIYAARLLMLSFFAATAVLAYLSLVRLGGDRWIALGATALTFASTYCLYYNDMVATEITSLFGVLLVFHGMTLVLQEGRFWQLALKSCVALLLGWHIYALLLPFILLGLVKEIVRARPAAENTAANRLAHWRRALRRGLVAFLTGPYFRLGLIALAFGLLVLGFNLFNEYRAGNGEVPWTELSTVKAMEYRTGFNARTRAGGNVAWLAGTRDGLAFLRGQFASIGIMAVPYALPGHASIFEVNLGGGRGLFETQSLVIGIAVFAAGLGGLFRLRQQRLLLLTLLLAGWCWAFMVPASVDVHDFEALFHIGIPLIFFLLLLRIVSKLSDRRLLVSLVLAALGIFVFASFQVSKVGYDAAAAAFQGEVVADFQALRKVTAGQSVYLASREAYHNFAEVTPAALYYLAGHPISENPEVYRNGRLAYLIQPHREEGLALLTPENRRAFLYDRAQYSGDIDQLSAVAGEPVARADFDLYLSANRIIYVKEPCGSADRDSRFMLHIIPADTGDLPPERREYGFDNLDFAFRDYNFAAVKRCIAVRQLPRYPIAAIRTGQFSGNGAEILWERELSIP